MKLPCLSTLFILMGKLAGSCLPVAQTSGILEFSRDPSVSSRCVTPVAVEDADMGSTNTIPTAEHELLA